MRMLPIFKHVEWATVSTEYTHSDNTTDKRHVHCVRNTSKSELLFILQCSASYNMIPYHILRKCVRCGGGQGTRSVTVLNSTLCSLRYQQGRKTNHNFGVNPFA